MYTEQAAQLEERRVELEIVQTRIAAAMEARCYPLLTTDYLLPTACYLLLTACYLLLATYYSNSRRHDTTTAHRPTIHHTVTRQGGGVEKRRSRGRARQLRASMGGGTAAEASGNGEHARQEITRAGVVRWGVAAVLVGK